MRIGGGGAGSPAQPRPAGAAAWRVLSARVGGIVQRGWKVKILMARQPLGQYELSEVQGPASSGAVSRTSSVPVALAVAHQRRGRG